MGADLSKIDIIDAIIEDGDEDRVSDFIIGEHSRDLAQLLTAGEPVGLLVVDPVSAYVGGTDSYNNAQVRAMLKPLSDLAADHDVAVVLVTHMRKSEAAKALHAAMGSLAFTAAARVVLLVSRDKDDPELRLLLTVKSNLASDRTGYRYKVEGGKVEWVEVVEGQADELLKGEPRMGKAGDRAGEKQQAMDAFAQQLKAAMAAGPVPTAAVRDMALRAGVSWLVVQKPNFKSQYGFSSRKEGSTWMWFVK